MGALSKRYINLVVFQFDIRIYVLLTSLDPLKIYMYDDGLVRIATELYTEDPASISESCIHVTNYDVNRRNTEKFIYNNNVSGYEGHKVRTLYVFYKWIVMVWVPKMFYEEFPVVLIIMLSFCYIVKGQANQKRNFYFSTIFPRKPHFWVSNRPIPI